MRLISNVRATIYGIVGGSYGVTTLSTTTTTTTTTLTTIITTTPRGGRWLSHHHHHQLNHHPPQQQLCVEGGGSGVDEGCWRRRVSPYQGYNNTRPPRLGTNDGGFHLIMAMTTRIIRSILTTRLFSSAMEGIPSPDDVVSTTRRNIMVGGGGSPTSTNTTNDDDDDDENDEAESNTQQQQQQQQLSTKSSSTPFRLYYNDVYEVILPPKHRFPMKKYRLVRQRIQQKMKELEGLLMDEKDGISKKSTNDEKEQTKSSTYDFCVSPLATIDELATTHDRKYIHRFLDGDQTDREQRNVGFPWSPSGVDRSLSSVGGTLAAACHVCEVWREQRQQQQQQLKMTTEGGQQQQQQQQMIDGGRHRLGQPLAPWSGHVAGGTHHAFYDYGEGFSVFSDIAVAANVVLDRFPDVLTNQRVLIVDLDVHQGNGNAVLFQNDPRVFTFSIHCEGNYFSPKEESDLDIELPIGCSDSLYLTTLNHWLNRLKKEGQFDMIFYQAGVDILEEDRLGRMNLTPSGVQKRNDMVYKFAHELNIPLVLSMGGGYPKSDDGWEVILQAHTDVYVQAYNYYRRQRYHQ